MATTAWRTASGPDWLFPTAQAVTMMLALAAIAGTAWGADRPGSPLPRLGDEICVCGQFFHTGTPVVLWLDPDGYDAYRTERRFAPHEEASWGRTRESVPEIRTPNRYGSRRDRLSESQQAVIDRRGWDLPLLQSVVDQFVLHYDVCGTSQTCFRVLHDQRGLSVHFMLDLDGTIYQTLDLKERAWHATSSNSRSIGIEIANMGAYPVGKASALDRWYASREGQTQIVLPKSSAELGIRQPNFLGRPDRPDRIESIIQDHRLEQYDFTSEQYAALIKLTAALCHVFPQIACDYPRDAGGQLIPHKLPDNELRAFQGILGHYHIQTNKTDPGPAMQWERLVREARIAMQP